MAKQGALNARLLVGGYNLSGDTGSLGRIAGPQTAYDVTGIDKSATERLGGQRDGAIEWVAFFNVAAGQAHPVLSALPTSDVVVTFLPGVTLGFPGACLVGKQINYDPTRGQDGSLTFAVAAQANGYGLEWGEQLTAGLRTDVAATNGGGVDRVASTAFGLQAYLQVTAFTGTDVTIKLQHSSDDAATDPYADIAGAAFTQVTAAPASQRIATANNLTIKRWLRAVTTTVGGVTSATFSVVAAKNLVSTAF